MLSRLSIKDIVLIDTLELSFRDGLCVLTGETGAGKSIILDALSFVLGARSSASLLKHGAQQGQVTACFECDSPAIKSLLEEQGIAEETLLILRRHIDHNGKTRGFVNDTPVSVRFLADLGEQLLEIHGQHDQRHLLQPGRYLDFVDQFGQLQQEKTAVAKAFEQFKASKEALAALQAQHEKSATEQDYLSFVKERLEALRPVSGEEGELAQKRERLLHKSKLQNALAEATALMVEGEMASHVQKLQQQLIKQQDKGMDLTAIIEGLERILVEVEEVSSHIDSAANAMDEEEESLESVEDRLFSLREAARKYGVETDGLSAYLEEVSEALNAMEHYEDRLRQAETALETAKSDYLTQAEKLTSARLKAAKTIESEVVAELAPLKMERTQFKLVIEAVEEASWSSRGIDKIHAMVSTNPGAPLAPIAKMASGGELSRFMLALKVVLSSVKTVPVMVFDEIDTGVGGAVADAIGVRLAKLGHSTQVLVVTHHPQVAAKASGHYKVEKTHTAKQSLTNVRELDTPQRREEIARMLAGENITDAARVAADELLTVN